MKKIKLIIIIASLGIICLPLKSDAKLVSQAEALKVATNWISLIINKNGTWGGAESAVVEEVRELKQKGKKIGYFCRISPKGFIIVSLRKELAPINAYSETSDLDPDADKGLTDVIKTKMSGIVNKLERDFGPLDAIAKADLKNMVETDYSSAWNALLDTASTRSSSSVSAAVEPRCIGVGPLLTSSWDQHYPYNMWAPMQLCRGFWKQSPAGCTAVAGAQIMRYWGWPPYGIGSAYDNPYDWKNMLDSYVGTEPQLQTEAVGELLYEAGTAAGTDYGCDESSASIGGVIGDDMLDGFKDVFRYHQNGDHEFRSAHSANGWFDIIKNNINLRRPLQYAIQTSWLLGGHSILLDGWQECGTLKQYHMNYGWGGSSDAWYTLDSIDDSETYTTENMLRKLRPAPSLDSTITGEYSAGSFPYRYFDQDATGSDALFNGGQYLQFLHGVKVTGSTSTGITFYGSNTDNTHLFSRGDTGKGIRINSGYIKLTNNGSIRLH